MDKNNALGWEEWLSLPSLSLPAIKAKVDTGARSSALHAWSIEPFGTQRNPKVRFVINPIPDNPNIQIICSAPIKDRRNVSSSNGESELRYVIDAPVQMGEREWPIEITLTNRVSMTYRMLLGRNSIPDEMIINPTESFLQPELSYDMYKSKRGRKPAKRALRLGLLTMAPNNYSNRRIIAAAEERGHTIEVITTSRCSLAINAHRPEVHYNGKALPRFDAIIPRIGASMTFYGMAVVRQFEMMGTYCVNTASAIGASRDKLLAHQVLSQHQLGMPSTAFAKSPDDTKHLIDLAGGAPVVVKLLESTQGKGVVLAESKKAAEAIIDAFRGLDAHFLVQEFVKEASGSDIRAFVVNGKVVASMMRTAAGGDFRSNLHMGGSAKKIRLRKEERRTAVKAAKILRLDVAGVDILRTEAGPKILEVNSSPGLEGIEKTSGVDVAGHILDCIEERVPTLVRVT